MTSDASCSPASSGEGPALALMRAQRRAAEVLGRQLDRPVVAIAASLDAALALAVCLSLTDRETTSPAPAHPRAGPNRTVALQLGQAVRLRAPVDSLLRLGGGRPLLVGTVEECTEAALAHALANAAAAAFVIDTRPRAGLVPLAAFAWAARAAACPWIALDRTGTQVEAALDAGAALALADATALGLEEGGIVHGDAMRLEAAVAAAPGLTLPFLAGAAVCARIAEAAPRT